MTFLLSISKGCPLTVLLGEPMCKEVASRNSKKASDMQTSCTATCAQRDLLHALPPKCVFKLTGGLMQQQLLSTSQHTIPKWQTLHV